MNLFRLPRSYGTPEIYERKMTFLSTLENPVRTEFVKTRHGKSHVTFVGSDSLPKLILLHGVMVNSSQIIEQFYNLSDHYQLIAVDILGEPGLSYGKRPKAIGRGYADWFHEVVLELKLENECVLGSSFGGYILLKTCYYHPELFKKRFFLQPAGLVSPFHGDSLREVIWPLIKYKIHRAEEHFSDFFHNLYGKENLPHSDRVKHMMEHAPFRPKFVQKMGKLPKGLEGKNTVFLSEHDALFPLKEMLERTEEVFGGEAEVVVLEGNSHVPNSAGIEKVISRVINS